MTFKSKNIEIKEKRSLTEMNRFVDDWASSRSKLKEEIERKSAIKFYIKKNEEGKITERVFEENNANEIKTNDIEPNNTLLYKEQTKKEKLSINKVRNVKNNKINKNQLIIKKIIIQSNSNSPNKKDKIYKENLENIEKIQVESNAELTANIKTLYTRQIYNDVLNTEEISNKKEVYISHYNPLSIYDNKNNLQTDKNIDKTKRSISLDLKEINPEKYNMLSKRKTLAAFNFTEVLRLKSELSKAKINISVTILKKAFLSPETVAYPKYYLPNSGFGLLTNPFP